MYKETFKEFGRFMVSFFITFLIGIGLYSIFCERKITSDKPITPEIRLTIKDNKTDTLYIYRNN